MAPCTSASGEPVAAFSSAARRHPRHPIILTKQRFHVLMAAESETHGFNFLQNTHGYKNQCRKAIWLTLFGASFEPKNCEKLLEMVSELKLPPGSMLRTHSPGLTRCEAPAVFLERGRCSLCVPSRCHRRRFPAFCSQFICSASPTTQPSGRSHFGSRSGSLPES